MELGMGVCLRASFLRGSQFERFLRLARMGRARGVKRRRKRRSMFEALRDVLLKFDGL